MNNIMANIYADLINKGLKTIDEVPDHLKSLVEVILGQGDK